MNYYDEQHKQTIDDFDVLWSRLTDLEVLAQEQYEIGDLAQDNNLKLLQTLIYFDFKNQAGREGSDAIDRYGHEWELKTCNALLVTGFSTNHHTNLERIAQFRRERWLFSIYEGINLKEVYAMPPADLEPYFSQWETKVNILAETNTDNPSINNPKIAIKFVRQHGTLVYPVNPDNPIDPAELLKEI